MANEQMQQGDNGAPASEVPFRTLLYRFMFFDWLFKDMNRARDLFERHAVLRHNKYMSRYLPVYLRRWTVMAAFDFALGFLFERFLQATIVAAYFFTWSCVSLAGLAVIATAWVFLTYGRLS